MLAKRVATITMSPTLRVSSKARELRAAGHDVLDFSAGQPDFPTPHNVKQAGRRAIDENQTRYTANEGILELRRAIADKIQRDHGLSYDTDQIVVSSGAKASLYFAFLALLDPGDEVLLPTPYWVSYPEQIRLAQAEPVLVACDEKRGFKLDVERLRAAVGPRTRAVVLNYPSNPTGACYSREELEPLAEFCAQHDLWVVADEIYSRMVYDGRPFTSIAQLGPEIAARTVMINGVSKTYSMTGWRIGYAAGPREVIRGMARIQSHSTSNAASISQWASVEALNASEEEAKQRVREFELRRNEVLRLLAELPGVRCTKPEGAFYVFPNVSAYFGRCYGGPPLTSGVDLAEYLLERARVAVVPGDAFGSPAHIRISYAISVERIREGMARVAEALAGLETPTSSY